MKTLSIFASLVLFPTTALASTVDCSTSTTITDTKRTDYPIFFSTICSTTIVVEEGLIHGLLSSEYYTKHELVSWTLKALNEWRTRFQMRFSDGRVVSDASQIYLPVAAVSLNAFAGQMRSLSGKTTISPKDVVRAVNGRFEVVGLYANYKKVIVAELRSLTNNQTSFLGLNESWLSIE